MGIRREDNDGECFALVEFKERGDQQLPSTRCMEISAWRSRKFHGNAVKQFQKMQPPQVGFLSQKWWCFLLDDEYRPYIKKVKPFKTYKTLWYI